MKARQQPVLKLMRSGDEDFPVEMNKGRLTITDVLHHHTQTGGLKS